MPASPDATALVLGAGAQGLTCALRLSAQGWRVVVLARGQLAETTSWGAGAIWEYPPFHVEPQADARRWVLASLGPFSALAENCGPSACGVRVRRSFYVYRSPAACAEARAAAAEAVTVTPALGPALDLQEGLPPALALRAGTGYGGGFSYRAPVVCMARYMPWLSSHLLSLGVTFECSEVRCAADVAAARQTHGASLVVNCLGLGAGPVFGDGAVHGVVGDLVYVRAPGLEEQLDLAHLSDEDHPEGLTYIVPQRDGVVALAGTAEAEQPGSAGAAEARREGILSRCRGVFAEELVGGEVVGSWSGLRPQRRGGIRLELDRSLAAEVGAPVIHNYGHGGSGVVTSWGCAEDVAQLALRAAASSGIALKPRELPPELRAAVAAAAGSTRTSSRL